ncbi:MAG: transcriptional regulator [Bacteroidia bacterium 44-10]|nr:MAG: transcriptional regulator [Bacteroidia bacterium 44-10]
MALRVKDICKKKGVSIGELADTMGIKRESLSRAINGNPTLDTLGKIAEALDVTVSDLFESGGSSLTCPNCGGKINITVTKE